MRRPPDSQAILIMLVLCGLWGFQQVAMKLIATDIDPLMQVALRCAIAALLVVAFSRITRGEPWLKHGTLGPGVLVGALFGLEYILISEGLRWTTAAHMSVFLYTAPIFAAIGLHFGMAAERLAPLQWLGIAIAFCGIAIAFLLSGPGQQTDIAMNMLYGDFLGLLAGAAWGYTTVAVRMTSLSEAPVAQTLFFQLLGGAICGLGFAAATGRTGLHFSLKSVSIMAYHAVIIAFASYMVWFWLLRRYLASRLSILSFLTPLSGILLGTLLLNEPLESGFLIGSAVVFAGILIVNGHDLRRR